MNAVRIEKPDGFEGIDGLVYEDAPCPQPATGDALVDVRAASFTPTELLWPLSTDRNGHDRGPRIPAHEGSGVVVELGYGTAGVSVGDQVFGLIDGYRDGWAAEYVAIEARSLAPKPTTIDFIEAAAIPQAGLTSWQALFDHGHVEPGQTVLIHGAGGGVGTMGVQLATWAGAKVIGSGRADLVSAYSSLAPTTSSTSMRMIGKRRSVPSTSSTTSSAATCSPIQARSSVKPGGAIVSIVAPPPTDRHDIRSVGFVRDPSGAQLRDIAGLIDEGVLSPQVGALYQLAEARQAFMAKSTEHIPGKVVLTP